MPKKTDCLSNYFVTAPNIDPELAFIKANEALRANEDNEVENTIAFLDSKCQHLQDPFLKPYWINCAEYFKEISPIQEPFKVVREDGENYCIGQVCDEKDVENIQKALDEEAFYYWRDNHKNGCACDSRHLLFGPCVWTISENESFLSQEELRLLFLETVDKERKKFERLKNKFSGIAGQKVERKREKISEEVRIFVWRRDEGRCMKCGSQKNLEFDHIIPVAKGGGNTARNIQILCEKCNREKSANI